jgi:hypothetical protein
MVEEVRPIDNLDRVRPRQGRTGPLTGMQPVSIFETRTREANRCILM